MNKYDVRFEQESRVGEGRKVCEIDDVMTAVPQLWWFFGEALRMTDLKELLEELGHWEGAGRFTPFKLDLEIVGGWRGSNPKGIRRIVKVLVAHLTTYQLQSLSSMVALY